MKINFRATPHNGTVTRIATAAILLHACHLLQFDIRHRVARVLTPLSTCHHHQSRHWVLVSAWVSQGLRRSSRRVFFCRLWRTGIVMPIVFVCVVPVRGCHRGGRHICAPVSASSASTAMKTKVVNIMLAESCALSPPLAPLAAKATNIDAPDFLRQVGYAHAAYVVVAMRHAVLHRDAPATA